MRCGPARTGVAWSSCRLLPVRDGVRCNQALQAVRSRVDKMEVEAAVAAAWEARRGGTESGEGLPSAQRPACSVRDYWYSSTMVVCITSEGSWHTFVVLHYRYIYCDHNPTRETL